MENDFLFSPSEKSNTKRTEKATEKCIGFFDRKLHCGTIISAEKFPSGASETNGLVSWIILYKKQEQMAM